MAVEETNAAGGVLGRKLELDFVDDGCDANIAYEAAKAFVSGEAIAGVVGGMCDVSAARTVPVIEGSSIPYLITSATASDLVSQDSTSAYMLNGTTYQQGLSAMYWMNYRGAQRLAVLQDETPESKDLARKAISAVDEVPKLVSLQTVEPGGQDMATIAKATIAAKPNFVLWTGGGAAGGELVKALRDAGYKGTFTATAASEDPAFLAAAGEAGEGAFVTATSTPLNTPTAEQWSARFEQRYNRKPGFEAQQGFDAVRTLAHAMNRSRSTESGKVLKAMTTLDAKFANALGAGAVRGRPHAALRQPRHPEGVRRSLHLGAVTAHGFAGVTRAAALLAALALAVGAPAALADGDPASDVLISERVFYPYEVKLPKQDTEALEDAVRSATDQGVRVRVALIAHDFDLGSAGLLVREAAGLREVPGRGAGELQPRLAAGRDAERLRHLQVQAAPAGGLLGPVRGHVPHGRRREAAGRRAAAAKRSEDFAAAAEVAVQRARRAPRGELRRRACSGRGSPPRCARARRRRAANEASAPPTGCAASSAAWMATTSPPVAHEPDRALQQD